MPPILELNAAALRWPAPDGGVVQALAPSSLTLHAGDRAVVRGPSGSGKTSLLLLAGGMLHPSAGDAHHKGGVGFVFQTLELLPYLNVRENVALGMRSNGNQTNTHVDALIDELGLTQRSRHRPHELSTGECQRAATARALVSDPALILADEPTGNLDDENAAIVLGALARHAERGAALLLATHAPLHGLEPSREFALDHGVLTELTGDAR
jgi:putative ABC transport system ATP-binding protein